MAGVAVIITVFGVLAFTMRNHVSDAGKKALWERVAAGLFGLAAFAAMVAFAPVLAVLWQVTGTGPGLVVLAVLLAATGFFGFVMVGRGKGHHHHGSVAVAVIFGVTMALAIGGWHQISHSAGQAMTSAGHATGGVVNGSALTAAGGHHQVAAAASTGGGRWAVIIALAALAVALIVFLRGYRKASRAAAPRRARGGRPGTVPLPAGPAVRPGGPVPVAGDAR
jgi:hypothetical protein